MSCNNDSRVCQAENLTHETGDWGVAHHPLVHAVHFVHT